MSNSIINVSKTKSYHMKYIIFFTFSFIKIYIFNFFNFVNLSFTKSSYFSTYYSAYFHNLFAQNIQFQLIIFVFL